VCLIFAIVGARGQGTWATGSVVVAQLDERLINKTDLCWSSMTDTEHNDPYERKRIRRIFSMYVFSRDLRLFPWFPDTQKIPYSYLLSSSLILNTWRISLSSKIHQHTGTIYFSIYIFEHRFLKIHRTSISIFKISKSYSIA